MKGKLPALLLALGFHSPATAEIEIKDDIVSRYSLYETFDIISEEVTALGKQLCDAAQQGNLSQVAGLIAKGVNVNFIKGELHPPRTPLTAAILGENLKVVKYLVTNGAKINRVLKEDTPAFILATQIGNEAIIAYLLEQGADPNITWKESISMNRFRKQALKARELADRH